MPFLSLVRLSANHGTATAPSDQRPALYSRDYRDWFHEGNSTRHRTDEAAAHSPLPPLRATATLLLPDLGHRMILILSTLGFRTGLPSSMRRLAQSAAPLRACVVLRARPAVRTDLFAFVSLPQKALPVTISRCSPLPFGIVLLAAPVEVQKAIGQHRK